MSSDPRNTRLYSLAALWQWLVEPPPTVIGAEPRRRARLLSALLLVLISAGLSAYGLAPAALDPPQVALYITLSLALLGLAYALSRTEHQQSAAILTVSALTLAILTETLVVQQTDILQLLIIDVLLCSISFSLRTTVVMYLGVIIGFLAVTHSVVRPTDLSDPYEWYSLVTVGALVVVITALRTQDLKFIAAQSQELNESKDRLATIFQTASEIMVICDQDQRIRLMNEAAALSFGYRTDEVLGQPLDMLLPPSQAGTHRQHVEAFLQSPELARRMNHRRSIVGRRKDGSEFPLEAGIARQPIGERNYLTFIASDITERQRAQLQLSQSEQNYRYLFEHNPNSMLVYDVTTLAFLAVNDATLRLYGYSRDEYARMTLKDIRPASELPKLAEMVGQPRPGTHRGETRHRKKDGSPIDVEVTSEPIEFEGRAARLVQVSDVTKRKQAEAETQRQMRRLAALRTIDTAIVSSLDLRVTLEVLLGQVVQELQVDAADVRLLNPHLQELEYTAGRGLNPQVFKGTRVKLGASFAGRVALERSLVQVPDLSAPADGGALARLFSAEGFRAYYGVPLVAKGEVKGVLEVLMREPYSAEPEWLDFLDVLGGQAAIAIDNAKLFEDLQRFNVELSLACDATLEGWSRALSLRAQETEGHTQRVTDLTMQLARTLGVSDADLVHIRRGAMLHDIGAMGVPDSILLKPGPLTEDEWTIMRKHPIYAYGLLRPIAYLRPALDIPYAHHEKWDGTGYPRGLTGEQIPPAARMFAVVDVWDALRSDRPYREAWPESEALSQIRSMSGTHFDPKVVDAFLHMMKLE